MHINVNTFQNTLTTKMLSLLEGISYGTPPKNSIITLIQTLTITLTLTHYDQNHMLIVKYTNSIDF